MRQPINNSSRVPAYKNSQEVVVSATSWLSPLPEIGEGFREWFEAFLARKVGWSVFKGTSFPSIKIYNNDMKKILLSLCLLLSSLLASAQYRNTSSEQNDEAKKQELRQQIGLDYSMPDYSVKKIEASVIGPRLAKILPNETVG